MEKDRRKGKNIRKAFKACRPVSAISSSRELEMVIWVLVVCLVGLHLGGLWVRYYFYVLREFFRILFTRTEVATPRRSISLLSSRLAHNLGFACSFQAWQNSSVPINPEMERCGLQETIDICFRSNSVPVRWRWHDMDALFPRQKKISRFPDNKRSWTPGPKPSFLHPEWDHVRVQRPC
jgi:hypothetical protein